MCISGIFATTKALGFSTNTTLLSHVSQKPEFYGTTCIFFFGVLFFFPTNRIDRFCGEILGIPRQNPMIYELHRNPGKRHRNWSRFLQPSTVSTVSRWKMVSLWFTIVDPIPPIIFCQSHYPSEHDSPSFTIHHHQASWNIMKHRAPIPMTILVIRTNSLTILNTTNPYGSTDLLCILGFGALGNHHINPQIITLIHMIFRRIIPNNITHHHWASFTTLVMTHSYLSKHPQIALTFGWWIPNWMVNMKK